MQIRATVTVGVTRQMQRQCGDRMKVLAGKGQGRETEKLRWTGKYKGKNGKREKKSLKVITIHKEIGEMGREGKG